MTDYALVTGGAGFLGSHICDRLIAEGCKVHSLDNYMTGRDENLSREVNQIHGDVSDVDSRRLSERLWHMCNFTKLKYVFNFACPASPPKYQLDPIHTMLTSVVGTQRMLHLAHLHGAVFVQASTSEIYGDPEEHPQREAYKGCVNTTGPRACYDEGKRAAEALCYDYVRKHNLDVRVVRIFNTYGPRMDPNDGRVVTNFINQALRGDDITIYGSGMQTRSFCYVDDLVNGIMNLAHIERSRDGRVILPVNIGNPHEFTMLDLAERVISLTDSSSKIIHKDLPQDDPTRRRPDIGRAKDLLCWEPSIQLGTGLEKTIAYFRKERGNR